MRREVSKVLSLLLALVVAFSISGLAYAQTTIEINPVHSVADPGQTFTINVDVNEVTSLYSYGIKIGFDSNILSVVTAQEGTFLSSSVPTAFVFKVFSGYVDIGCTTLGLAPGVSGSGTLFNVTFQVNDAGHCILDLYDTTLLDPTLTPITHGAADGTFATDARANLVRRSAWPEHHHFDISKDEDSAQTMNAKVKNLGTLDLWVRVSFEVVRDDGFTTTVYSSPVVVTAGTIVNLSGDLPLTGADTGKYAITARCWYSWTGSYYVAGEKNKTFSFAAVP